ncbi:MAG: hypothetical protein WAZ12_02875 [Candidatus Absconditicoccaceae bacterium]
MSDKKINTSKREGEQATDKHYISRIAGKIKTLFLNSSTSVERLKEIYQSLTYQNLQSGSGPYQDYYFSGKNKIIDSEGFEKGDLDMFKNINLLEDILTRDATINFEGNPKIRYQVHKLAQSLIKNKTFTQESPIIDPNSKKNINAAFVEAEATNRKIFFIANHASHFDTPILSYTLDQVLKNIHQEHPEIPVKKIRFVCGAYMYYNKGVRNFTAGFDTTLVFGPKDLQEIKTYLEENSRKDLIIKFNREAIKKTQENAQTETTILFPYAGRAENKNGCKDELPKGISQYLENADCIYVPIGCVGSDSIFPTGNLYEISQNVDIFKHIKNIIKYIKFSQLIKLLNPNADQKQLVKIIKKAEPIDIVIWLLDNLDIFKLFQFLEKYKFKFFKPGNIHMTIGEYFVGGQKTLEEINHIMHKVADDAMIRNDIS